MDLELKLAALMAGAAAVYLLLLLTEHVLS